MGQVLFLNLRFKVLKSSQLLRYWCFQTDSDERERTEHNESRMALRQHILPPRPNSPLTKPHLNSLMQIFIYICTKSSTLINISFIKIKRNQLKM